MEDPDLEIIRWGRGGEPVLKIIFWALRASDWSDKKEGRALWAPPLDPTLAWMENFCSCTGSVTRDTERTGEDDNDDDEYLHPIITDT